MEKRVSTRSIVITGMFAAVIAVLAQVALPMPSGVPVTPVSYTHLDVYKRQSISNAAFRNLATKRARK